MKIFAAGFNHPSYNKQAIGSLYDSGNPVIFTKADSALLRGGRPLFLPDDLGVIDCEVSLVVRISRLGKSIPERFAHRYYDAVTVGVDFTARDLLLRLQRAGLPWEMAKGFDGAAAIGEWTSLSPAGSHRFRLDIDGTTVQQGSDSDLLHSADALIAYISRWFTLRTGDIIFTGAPAPPTAVAIDNHLTGYLNDKKVLEFNVK